MAHEVGHTLGLAHNFAGSTYEDITQSGSVMDYPPPVVTLDSQGNLVFNKLSYSEGIGYYDKIAVNYAYRVINTPKNSIEAAASSTSSSSNSKTSTVTNNNNNNNNSSDHFVNTIPEKDPTSLSSQSTTATANNNNNNNNILADKSTTTNNNNNNNPEMTEKERELYEFKILSAMILDAEQQGYRYVSDEDSAPENTDYRGVKWDCNSDPFMAYTTALVVRKKAMSMLSVESSIEKSVVYGYPDSMLRELFPIVYLWHRHE